MFELILWLFILGISLFVLIKVADYFVEAAEKVGLILNVPCFIIGITVVAIGTSLPELVSSIVAVLKQSSEIVPGNVVGSNIANVFLVLGVAAISVKNLQFNSKFVDIFILLAASLMFLFGSLNYIFTIYEGIIFLIGLVVYLIYITKSGEYSGVAPCEVLEIEKEKKGIVFLVLGISCFFIYLGSDWTVTSVVQLSSLLGIPKEFIAITIVAFGTSLPELHVTISAAKKNNSDMIVGNILGSCIFNIWAIMGISVLFGNIIITKNVVEFALPVMLLSALFLVINYFCRKIPRFIGGIYLLLYAGFILALVFRL